jgi:hypothetical protein
LRFATSAPVLTRLPAATRHLQDGKEHAQELAPNSTITILPGARHQFMNEGADAVSFVLAFDNPPMRPVLFSGWRGPASEGKAVAQLPWDEHCPGKWPPGVGPAAAPAAAGRDASEL